MTFHQFGDLWSTEALVKLDVSQYDFRVFS